jgi:xanthine dehydrogenase small subunit
MAAARHAAWSPWTAVQDTPNNLSFLVNGRTRRVEPADQSAPLLPYLRETLGLTGCKEGCSEGDCGACMVLVQDVEDGLIRTRSMNACITLLGAVGGKAVTTVEGLVSEEGDCLHAVQCAMLDQHASQCGFCTPGFIMSQVAMFAREPSPSDDAIRRHLAGNLCRCTGYRPIIEAARSLRGSPAAGLPARPSMRQWLLAAQPLRPATLDALFDAMQANPDAVLIAGGTDLVPRALARYERLKALIWLTDVVELRETEVAATHIDLGGAVSLTDVGTILSGEYPELAELVRRVASPSITDNGTIAGNLVNGSPVGDYIPALVALGASVQLRSRQAERWVDLDVFYTGYRTTVLRPGEVVTRVRVPVRRPDQIVGFYKVAKRFEQDTASVLAAFALTVAGDVVTAARVSFGGMSAVHGRADHTERMLVGARWSTGLPDARTVLERDYQPLSDLRGSREFRLRVAANLLTKFHRERTGEAVSVWREGGSA